MNNQLICGECIQNNDLLKIGQATGLRLKTLRKNNKLTQENLEKLTKISQSTLSKIENGLRMISINEAKKLAKILNSTPEYLISGQVL